MLLIEVWALLSALLVCLCFNLLGCENGAIKIYSIYLLCLLVLILLLLWNKRLQSSCSQSEVFNKQKKKKKGERERRENKPMLVWIWDCSAHKSACQTNKKSFFHFDSCQLRIQKCCKNGAVTLSHLSLPGHHLHNNSTLYTQNKREWENGVKWKIVEEDVAKFTSQSV